MHRNHSRKHSIAFAALIFVTAGWGLTFPLIKDSIESVRPFTFIAIRFVMAMSVLIAGRLGFSALRPRNESKGIAEWAAGLMLGLVLFGTYSLQTIGMQETSSSSAGFLTGLSVVIVPLILLVVGVRIAVFSWIGIGLSIVGAGLLSLTESLTLGRGDLLVIGCAFTVALHIVLVGRFSRLFDPVRMTFIQIGFCLVLTAICAVLVEYKDFDPASYPASAWGAMAFCGVIATAVAYLVQNMAQAFVSPVKTALILTLEPVFGAIFSVLLLQESLRPLQWAGGGVMVMAMVIAEAGPLIQARRKASENISQE